jgi:hypothetical protein
MNLYDVRSRYVTGLGVAAIAAGCLLGSARAETRQPTLESQTRSPLAPSSVRRSFNLVHLHPDEIKSGGASDSVALLGVSGNLRSTMYVDKREAPPGGDHDPVPGITLLDGDWFAVRCLLAAEKNHSDVEAWAGRLTNPTPAAHHVTSIVGAVRAAKTPADKAKAFVSRSRALYNKTDKVCRHYAYLIYCAAGELGYENRWLTNGSHSWNEVKIDGHTFIVDGFWPSCFEK